MFSQRACLAEPAVRAAGRSDRHGASGSERVRASAVPCTGKNQGDVLQRPLGAKKLARLLPPSKTERPPPRPGIGAL